VQEQESRLNSNSNLDAPLLQLDPRRPAAT